MIFILLYILPIFALILGFTVILGDTETFTADPHVRAGFTANLEREAARRGAGAREVFTAVLTRT